MKGIDNLDGVLDLKQIRIKRNLTTKALSDLTGVSRSYITELENGKYDNPGLITICALCKGLKLTPNELIPEKLYK